MDASDTAAVLAVEVYYRASQIVALTQAGCTSHGHGLNEIQEGLLIAAIAQALDGTEQQFQMMLEIQRDIERL